MMCCIHLLEDCLACYQCLHDPFDSSKWVVCYLGGIFDGKAGAGVRSGHGRCCKMYF